MILKNKWLRVIPVLLLLISFTQIGSTRPSLASTPTIAGLPASFFELDGNACQDTSPRPDWGVLPSAFYGGNSSGNCTGSSSPAPVSASLVRDGVGGNDSSTFTTGSSKITSPLSGWLNTTTGSSPAKADIEDAFVSAYNRCPAFVTGTGGCQKSAADATPVTPQLYTYYGGDRLDNSGDTLFGVWLFKSQVFCCDANNHFITQDPTKVAAPYTVAHHSNGDLLISTDFTIGGNIGTLVVREWTCSGAVIGAPCVDASGNETGSLGAAIALPGVPPGGVDCSPAAGGTAFNASTEDVCGTVNHTDGTKSAWSYKDKSNNSTYLKGEFFEGGTNISDLVPGDTCFGSFMDQTQSATGNSVPAGQDYTLGSFNTCKARVTLTPHEATNSIGASHTITVHTQGSSDNGATFTDVGPSPVTLKTSIIAAATPPNGDAAAVITGGTCFTSAQNTAFAANPVSTATGTTDNTGTCNLTMTSSTVQTIRTHADATVTFSGQTLNVSTSSDLTITDGTGDAIKHFVAGSITLHKSVEVGIFAGYPDVCFALSYHSSVAGDLHVTPISTDAATAPGTDPSYSPASGATAAGNTNKECHQYSAADTTLSPGVKTFDFTFHGLATSHYDLTESIVPSTAPWNLARTDTLTNIAVDATAATDGTSGIADQTITACSAATVAPACDQPANPLKPGHLTIVKKVNGDTPASGSFDFSVFRCADTGTTARTLNQDGSVASVGTCGGYVAGTSVAVDTETLQSSNSFTATTGSLHEGYYLVHETPPDATTGFAVDPTTQDQVVQVYAGDCKIVNGACDPSVTSIGLTATVNNKLLYNIVVATCQQSNNTLVPSEVDLNGTTTFKQNSLATGNTPTGVDETKLCTLSRANFQHLLPSTGTSSYSMNVHLNKSGTESSPISP